MSNYVWDKGVVRVIHTQILTSEAKNYNIFGLFMLDSFHDLPLSRYGMFMPDKGAIYQWGARWVSIPLEQFPPEFRVHLLLLGVS